MLCHLEAVKSDFTMKECYNGAEEMDHMLGHLAALAEDPGALPSTHMTAKNFL